MGSIDSEPEESRLHATCSVESLKLVCGGTWWKQYFSDISLAVKFSVTASWRPVDLSKVIHPCHWDNTKIRSWSRLGALKSRAEYIAYEEASVASSEHGVECFEPVKKWVIWFPTYDVSKWSYFSLFFKNVHVYVFLPKMNFRFYFFSHGFLKSWNESLYQCLKYVYRNHLTLFEAMRILPMNTLGSPFRFRRWLVLIERVSYSIWIPISKLSTQKSCRNLIGMSEKLYQ